MLRTAVTITILILTIAEMEGQQHNAVVADSATHTPLPSASIFDRHGNAAGITGPRGHMPRIPSDSYPITIRYLGYRETTVPTAGADTVFLCEILSELPEIVVESREHKVLHILAYIREYSTLTSLTDTVQLFREKMVDYMLPTDRKTRFRGWTNPRVLSCRSYYRFTDALGLDSVSDESNYHFSWSDWVGIAPVITVPATLRNENHSADTIHGRYSPAEIWTRSNDRLTVDVNVLADTIGRRWAPSLKGFFRDNLDFQQFNIRFNYDSACTDSVTPVDLSGYSFNIESNGRGHEMFFFNRVGESPYINTYAEVYIMDKEYITVKEAKKWDKRKFDIDSIGILEPTDAPELQPPILELVWRVNNIDREAVRLAQTPDERLMSRYDSNRNFRIEERALSMLKQLLGITLIKSHRNMNRRWDQFRHDWKSR